MLNRVDTTAGANSALNTPLTNGAPGVADGELSFKKDATEASTAPKFGDVYNKIQATMGAKLQKPREIKKTLGKDDFLKIMITQMKFQDPTSPFKPEQMAAEMAQFTSVEQLQNMNQNISKMTGQNRPLERLAMTNMIGKVVTIDRDRFPHTEGNAETLSYHLPKDAADVQVAVVSEAGEVVFEQNLGPKKAGEISIPWDGTKSDMRPAKSGNFMLRVAAKDDQGRQLQLASQAKAKVIGISFEGNEPVFLVGDATHQEKFSLNSIAKIELESEPASKQTISPRSSSIDNSIEKQGQKPTDTPNNNSAKTVAQAPTGALTPVLPENTGKPNFISFQKGLGSGNLDTSQLPAEHLSAIRKYEEAQAQAEKGFPNGLHDSDTNDLTPNNQTTQTLIQKGGDK